MRTLSNEAPKSLGRTIASASRKLEKDINLTPLKAIDRLQQLSNDFRDQWIGPSPWLVLEDCYCLPAKMPVQKMLEEMETHGAAIGIVGMALLKETSRHAVLRMLFRKDARSKQTVERSFQTAQRILLDAVMKIDVLNVEDKG
jgi:hypothetical protein